MQSRVLLRQYAQPGQAHTSRAPLRCLNMGHLQAGRVWDGLGGHCSFPGTDVRKPRRSHVSLFRPDSREAVLSCSSMPRGRVGVGLLCRCLISPKAQCQQRSIQVRSTPSRVVLGKPLSSSLWLSGSLASPASFSDGGRVPLAGFAKRLGWTSHSPVDRLGRCLNGIDEVARVDHDQWTLR